MKVSQVLNGHVLVRPKTADAVAGIAIPDSVDKERPTMGTVVIGTTISDGEHGLATGATVLFHSLSPRKVIHDGEECLLIHGEDIYAVTEE